MAKVNRISNAELWDLLRNNSGAFRSITPKATSDLFSERGFMQLKQDNKKALNDFFELTMQTYLQKLDVATVKDNLDINGFGEQVLNPLGGYIQRLSIDMVKPINPGWLGLENGDSPDQFVVRKGNVKERMFQHNLEHANLITIPDEIIYKDAFITPYGMDELVSGMLSQLNNSYIEQQYYCKLEALSAGLNSEDLPLQDSQIVEVALSDNPTEEELLNFLIAVSNVKSAMDSVPATDAFNQLKFRSSQDTSRLKLLVRVGTKNLIKQKLLAGSFNPEQLNLGLDIIEVANFGGLTPYKEEGFTTPLFPVYGKLGEVIGYAETEGATEATVSENEVFFKDPNEDTIAVLADKDLIFTAKQGNYSVEPVRNVRGLYTNYWASAPRGTVAYDGLYNVVVFKKGDTKKD